MSWCPTPSCGYAFVKTQSEIFCEKCLMGYCLDCRVEMHYGMTCTEFKVDKVNNSDDSEVINMI